MVKINDIFLDVETYSDVDLGKAGVYRYAESDAFEILLFGYSVNGAPVNVIDLTAGEEIPEEIIEALADETVTKWAHNCAFERVCLSAWMRRHRSDMCSAYLSPAGWKCSMVWAAYMGLPLSLDSVGAVLKLKDQKMAEGKSLIRYFCSPCRPTKANCGRTRNLPEHAPDKWSTFIDYNRRDVEVEMQIRAKLAAFPVPETVWQEYWLDQEINDRGIMVDTQMAESAICLDETVRADLMRRMHEMTGLENPNSVVQLKDWLSERGVQTESLDKKAVKELLKDAPADVRDVLLLRQQISKSSVRKYQAMMNSVCSDDRAHGMFQFYGASRSGRWAGRIVQLQNLPQNHMPDLGQARDLVKAGDAAALTILYDSVPDVLSELIRTAFVPRPGCKFIVADFSAIEARVLAWLSGETWRMVAFERGEDIYCASASQMFGVPVEKHGVNGHLRQKGKIAELALGYGGSTGALKAMGALEMGLEGSELQPLVDTWRKANPAITAFWWSVDSAVKNVIKTKGTVAVGNIRFEYRSGMLLIHLPSGRHLTYVKPRIGENRFGGESVTYMGLDTQKKYSRIESYGPKFVENITQAISRDVLCCAMIRMRNRRIVGHVHDEIIIEASTEDSVDWICEQMGMTPSWAEGLQMRADGYECAFYRKD